MPDRPYPDIWARLRSLVEANPTPIGEWRLTEGENRLVGAVQHAQSEPDTALADCYCCSAVALGRHCRTCHAKGYCG